MMTRLRYRLALVLALAVTALAAPAAASPLGIISVRLAATFGSLTTVTSAIGVRQGVSAHGRTGSPFQFLAACSSTVVATRAVACGPVTYSFGDGTSVTSTKPVSHGYAAPGVYTVTASAAPSTYAATSLTVVVGPSFPDVPLDSPDAPAITAAAAKDLLAPCSSGFCSAPSSRNAPPAVLDTSTAAPAPPRAAGYALASTTGVWVGQVLTVNSQSTMITSLSGDVVRVSPRLTQGVTRGTAVQLFPALATPLVNGLSGVSCLASAATCGLPYSYFAGGSCATGCERALINAGYLTASTPTRLIYSPLDCADGYVAVRYHGGWQVSPGVETGCVSRRAFLSALVALVGPAGHLAPSPCVDDHSVLIRTAAALGLAAPLVGPDHRCLLDAALTKSVAYRLLAALAPRSNPAAASALRDVAGTTLAGPLGALLVRGVPLVGSLTCPAGPGLCLNPDQPVTRADAARLLASVLLAPYRVTGGASLVMSSSATQATVHASPAPGEPVSAATLVVTGPGVHCVRVVRLGPGPVTATCPLPDSHVPRILTAVLNGAWGTPTAVSAR